MKSIRYRDAFKFGMKVGVGALGYRTAVGLANYLAEKATEKLDKLAKEIEQAKWREAGELKKQEEVKNETTDK